MLTYTHAVTQTDFKGAVPKSVVNFLASRAPKLWMANLRKGIKKLSYSNAIPKGLPSSDPQWDNEMAMEREGEDNEGEEEEEQWP